MIGALATAGLFLASAAVRAAEPIDPPAAAGALAPNFAAAGRLVLLSWLEPLEPGRKPGEGGMALRYAAFDGARWSSPRTIASGTTFFANWADFPALASAAPGWLLAAWPEKSGTGDLDYSLELARADSADGPWRRIGAAHERGSGEHGFVSLLPEGDGIRAFWLDGRQMTGDQGAMSLRTAFVRDEAEPSVLLDGRVCDCCQTGAATTSAGPIVVYRGRSDRELRDTAIVRRPGGGWTAPRLVAQDGWKIAGCPVNGPAAAASGRQVAVAWFTAAGDKPSVRLALSSDAGASFGKAIEVDGAGPAGRVGVVIATDGDAVVTWVAPEERAAAIRARRVSPDGRLGEAYSVAQTSLARSSGIPRIAVLGSALLVAWVEPSEPFRLHAARVPLSAIPRAR